jgi:hypothetical protein
MTTLDEMPAKKKPEPSAEEAAAMELVRHPQEQGLSPTGANARPRTARPSNRTDPNCFLTAIRVFAVRGRSGGCAADQAHRGGRSRSQEQAVPRAPLLCLGRLTKRDLQRNCDRRGTWPVRACAQVASESGRHVLTRHTFLRTTPSTNPVVRLVRITLELASNLPDALHLDGDSRTIVRTMQPPVENTVDLTGFTGE